MGQGMLDFQGNSLALREKNSLVEPKRICQVYWINLLTFKRSFTKIAFLFNHNLSACMSGLELRM